MIVIGGGNEAQKRVQSLQKQGCKIIVISDSVNSQLIKLAKENKIIIQKQKVQDTKFVSKLKPDMIITTTNNQNLNKKIIDGAKKRKVIAYSSDNPEDSDFSNPAIIEFEKIIQIAIFTGGKSPAMSKQLKKQIEKECRKAISKEDIEQIKIQAIARKLAKEKIDSQIHRKAFLTSIMDDKKIKQLIKDRKGKNVEKHIITMLRDWK